ncbi:MAG: lipase family protein, partial [Deltaproteobacteria bacterium]|nr:lipase family protein [Deltaproteobacteria bacterium]
MHRGFQAALDEVWERLHDYLEGKENARRTVWFTGHSLGAALATLAASRYGKVRGLYTFGSPRVGDLDFKQAFLVPTYRFVNHDDLVTRVPPP